jgi:hypothetical protein
VKVAKKIDDALFEASCTDTGTCCNMKSVLQMPHPCTVSQEKLVQRSFIDTMDVEEVLHFISLLCRRCLVHLLAVALLRALTNYAV